MAKLQLLEVLFLIFLVCGCGSTDPAIVDLNSTKGGTVDLPCSNLLDDQPKCQKTTWLFVKDGGREVKKLAEHGTITDILQKNRLSISTPSCSLVIKNFKEDDAGIYICRQHSTPDDYFDSIVYLSLQEGYFTVAVVASVLAAIAIVTAVASVMCCQRRKGICKSQDNTIVQERGPVYASISLQNRSQAKVHDTDDKVTYDTVKCSPAWDPSSL